ncbi:hypothetical protein LO763_19970 [Glycomyces sp. A-F 0318]|uniref:hypothetical protein n=1 Tax=Glycomyces amatae TaxID=2881355 RepID=UPI001E3E8D62|nr:hypothetical protein [Glycomyces amatae]MCD0445891.1 hypothetical protein [Glycomyces amatae]
MVPRKALLWSLLAALICGAVAVVVVTSVWGGTPWRQVPFVIASLLIGAFLPLVTTAVVRQDSGTPSRQASKQDHTAMSVPQAPSLSSQSDQINAVSEAGPKREFQQRIATIDEGGLLLTVVLIVFLTCVGVSLMAGDLWPVGICALSISVLGIVLMANSGWRRVRMVLNADGVLLASRAHQVWLPWPAIDAVTVVRHRLVLESSLLTHDDANKIGALPQFSRSGHRVDLSWTPRSRKVVLFRINEMPYQGQELEDAIEHSSGRSYFSK